MSRYRRRAPRTYRLVANTLGVANCQTVAPPALGETQQGKAAVPKWTAAHNPEHFDVNPPKPPLAPDR